MHLRKLRGKAQRYYTRKCMKLVGKIPDNSHCFGESTKNANFFRTLFGKKETKKLGTFLGRIRDKRYPELYHGR